MMGSLKIISPPPPATRFRQRVTANGDGFPTFLPKEIQNIKDPFARALAQRIVRIPVPLQVLLLSFLHELKTESLVFNFLNFV